MKLLTSLIAITALGLATSAFAQEEEATSTPVEEQPSTTIEETPAPAPTIETTPSTPEKMAPPATSSPAAKAEKPASTAKTSSPAKAASPAKDSSAMAAPAASGKKMSVEASLKDNENRWAAAAVKHDMKTVESMVADDFLGINSKGKVQNRRALLGEMKNDKDAYTSTKNEKLDVHMYGKGVAVVVGTYREKGTGKDAKSFDRSYRFTDTWVERNGQWKCVASQSMLLAGR
jgi:ketosteroid isomerase-like protein